MKKRFNKLVQAMFVFFFLGNGMALAESHVVDQKQKKFSETNITIKRGDTIRFTNSDSVAHNIHSLTDSDSFDLGSYRKGEERTHVFKNLGIHEVECAIHPFMFMTVTVEK